jgi:hypothetical protein
MSLKARQRAQIKSDAAIEQAQLPARASWAQPFPDPIHGDVDGEAVRILVLGDQPGSSPVYLCVDAEGTSAIVPLADVTITDGAFLPLRMRKTK